MKKFLCARSRNCLRCLHVDSRSSSRLYGKEYEGIAGVRDGILQGLGHIGELKHRTSTPLDYDEEGNLRKR